MPTPADLDNPEAFVAGKEDFDLGLMKLLEENNDDDDK